jgi:hypothetical protein
MLIDSLSNHIHTFTYVTSLSSLSADEQLYSMIMVDTLLTVAIAIGLKRCQGGWTRTDALIKRIIVYANQDRNHGTDDQLYGRDTDVAYLGCDYHVYPVQC